jgi:quercetin dioxygenase-like cupin family protein
MKEDAVNSTPSETIRIGALAVRFLVEGADSNGSAAVFECSIPAGGNMPAAHSHDAYEETIYGLEGVSTWTVDGVPAEIGPGEALCIPRGVVHRFDNHGTGDAKVLVLISPGILGPDYFRELGAVLAAVNSGPPDRAQIGEVMRRHGLTLEPSPAA